MTHFDCRTHRDKGRKLRVAKVGRRKKCRGGNVTSFGDRVLEWLRRYQNRSTRYRKCGLNLDSIRNEHGLIKEYDRKSYYVCAI